MDFGANKRPVEVTCFRDINCGINKKWYKKSWK